MIKKRESHPVVLPVLAAGWQVVAKIFRKNNEKK
jgi:hypothetical protein